ncbi:unnamed protein product [Caenorhabditis sp. 36 PRJEB53466]|nr:unnamed protein product [Caenorhabditis sp. 36 PRJEB53466]
MAHIFSFQPDNQEGHTWDNYLMLHLASVDKFTHADLKELYADFKRIQNWVNSTDVAMTVPDYEAELVRPPEIVDGEEEIGENVETASDSVDLKSNGLPSGDGEGNDADDEDKADNKDDDDDDDDDSNDGLFGAYSPSSIYVATAARLN